MLPFRLFWPNRYPLVTIFRIFHLARCAPAALPYLTPAPDPQGAAVSCLVLVSVLKPVSRLELHTAHAQAPVLGPPCQGLTHVPLTASELCDDRTRAERCMG